MIKITHWSLRIIAILLLSCSFNHLSLATPLSPQAVPPPLQPWIDWVLQDTPEYTCPFNYHQTTHRCHWPAQLILEVTAQQAMFTQTWQLYRPDWIALPGDTKYWPQTVQIEGKAALVTDRNGTPHIFLPRGQTTIQGYFYWQQRPKYLQVPANTGLVDLTVDKKAVAIPKLDAKGRLWLGQRDGQAEASEADRMALRVYRRIIDDIPLQMITRIELDVAGRHREEILGPVMLAQQVAMSLDSPLPARLEPDGRLRIQVRPGFWQLTLRTRQPGLVDSLTLLTPKAQWVKEEVWVFEARNTLRLVEIQGVTTIDPQQTTLPSAWRQFPTYRLQAGDTLTLLQKRRGDPEPNPDQLALERHFWLDFDGQGYSIQDHISGNMSQNWRLDMLPPATLGRVAVHGQNQLITHLADSEQMGVEVRQGEIDLVADSRLEEALVHLPAISWDHDFHQVSTYLHLPPGWHLLEASGVDNVSDTWFRQWTLFDLFVVLIMATAVGKLWRWWWGIFTLVTLALIYHEPQAPQWIWLHIIVSIALVRVLPEIGWWHRPVRWYRDLSFIALLVIALPFMMQQARQSLYPQLEYPWAQLDSALDAAMSPPAPKPQADIVQQMDTAENTVEEMQQVAKPEAALKKRGTGGMYGMYPMYGMGMGSNMGSKEIPSQLVQIDPNAQVQTGPGLPQWTWEDTITLNWHGPVLRNQSIHLWLLSPAVNRVLGFIRIVLLAILIAYLISTAGYRTMRSLPNTRLALTGLGWILLGLLNGLPVDSYAETPPPMQTKAAPPTQATAPITKTVPVAPPPPMLEEKSAKTTPYFPPQFLLDTLKTRLLEPPDCLPHCASSPRLSLTLDATQLQGRLEIHSAIPTALPLPGIDKQWLPQQVWVDGVPASGLLRDQAGQLWISLTPGIHQIQLQGPLPRRNTVQLPLPLKPHFVEVDATGWLVEGVHENGVADDQLQFTRQQLDATQLAELEMGTLPPFVHIERTLRLGLDWQIETRVIRQTPLGTAIMLEIPLLAGESVTTEGIRVENGKALINLSPRATKIQWTSVFNKQETLQLTAIDNLASTEIWRLDASAIWHVEIMGIPPVHHQNKGRWLPEWRPWPGESITLQISRPESVTGQILTLDQSQLKITPGLRVTDYTLSLNFRSSQGGHHPLTLPPEAQLQQVKIKGESQPIRQEAQQVTLPITPGEQQVELQFQQPTGITQRFHTPAVALGLESVNTTIEIDVPRNRWILFTGGGLLGPAVMIWGVLIVIVLVAIGLGRLSFAPLKTYEWLLLGIVLSQVPAFFMLCVVGWFMALSWRARLPAETPKWQFNLTQVGLVALTLIAASVLLAAIYEGLLGGYPNMHISGNGSSDFFLRWYEDRTQGTVPSVWFFSLPMWVYRVAMLLWALWLSFALLRWSRWGWQCFSTQGLWRSFKMHY